MRRFRLCLILAGLAIPAIVSSTTHAQTPPPAQLVPHAWLFGSWTGGLFPVPSTLTAQQCLAQPVVVFTRDVVLRATLIDTTYQQRVIETVRSDPNGTDFRFTPSVDIGGGLLGATAGQPQAGFGCGDTQSLHVVRRSDNEIVFQGCRDFPEPLIRCPAR